jgi:hypothetical protein
LLLILATSGKRDAKKNTEEMLGSDRRMNGIKKGRKEGARDENTNNSPLLNFSRPSPLV